MNLKDKTCCFTGHRDIPNSILPQLRSQINEVVTALIESGICFFGAGGAIGFDTLAAETVLNLRDKYPHVKLILVLPCPEQADRWSREAMLRYEQIKKVQTKSSTPVNVTHRIVCFGATGILLMEAPSVYPTAQET